MPLLVPLSTHIRTRAKQHPHAFLLAKPDKCCNVFIAGLEIKYTLFLFLIIPEYVSSNGITTHRFGHLYAVPPVLAWNPGRMHLAADDLHGLAIQQEILFIKAELMLVALCG